MFVLARIDYHHWQRFSLLICWCCVGAAGRGAGARPRASQLRLDRAGCALGPFQIQPSELDQAALVLYMADWLARKGKRVGEFTTGSLPFVIILGLVCFLVMIEPDLGTTVVIAVTAISVFCLAGANLLHFVGRLWLLAAGAVVRLSHVGYRMRAHLGISRPLEGSRGHRLAHDPDPDRARLRRRDRPRSWREPAEILLARQLPHRRDLRDHRRGAGALRHDRRCWRSSACSPGRGLLIAYRSNDAGRDHRSSSRPARPARRFRPERPGPAPRRSPGGNSDRTSLPSGRGA